MLRLPEDQCLENSVQQLVFVTVLCWLRIWAGIKKRKKKKNNPKHTKNKEIFVDVFPASLSLCFRKSSEELDMDKVTAAMVLTSLSTSPLVRSPPVRPNGKPLEPGAAGRGARALYQGACFQELWPWWRTNGEWLSSGMLGIILSFPRT